MSSARLNVHTLLVTPPYHARVLESAGRWPPLGLLYIAGALRARGFGVGVYDAMTLEHSVEEIRSRIEDERPRVVGTGAYTCSYYAAIDVLRAAKQVDPRTVTVLGGVHPTFCYEDALTAYRGIVDFVVRGEGENTMAELVSALAGGASESQLARIPGLAFVGSSGSIVATPPRTFAANLDGLTPAWDLVDWDDYRLYFVPGSRIATISSSRGCIHECGFCSQQKFWCNTYRERSAESFLADIDHLYRRYGANTFLLSDEFPTRNRERWEAVLDGLIHRSYPVHLLIETCAEAIVRDADLMEKYRKAGVLHIYVGVEATRQSTLDLFKKDIRCEQSREALRLINDAGMISECSFILGVPEETSETIADTLALAKYYDPHYAHFLSLTPWPYADMYNILKPHIEDFDYSHYNLVRPVIRPAAMTRGELEANVFDCYKQFYMWKLPRWTALPDSSRRDYLIRSMREMLNRSFLKERLNDLGAMPAEVEAHLRKIGISVPPSHA